MNVNNNIRNVQTGVVNQQRIPETHSAVNDRYQRLVTRLAGGVPEGIEEVPALGQPVVAQNKQAAQQALDTVRNNIIALRDLINNNIINEGTPIKEVQNDQDLTNQFLSYIEDHFNRLINSPTNQNLPRLQDNQFQAILESARDCGLYRIVRDITIKQNNNQGTVVRDFVNMAEAANYSIANVQDLINALQNMGNNPMPILGNVITAIQNRFTIEVNREEAELNPSRHIRGILIVYALTFQANQN